jgi:hypothetical protein
MVYYNGQCVRNSNGVIFQSDEKSGFMVSAKSNITHLKKRVAQKENLEDHQIVPGIIYRHPMLLGDGSNMLFEALKIKNNEDIKYMFINNSQFTNLRTIELYVIFQPHHSFNPQLTAPHIHPHVTSPHIQPHQISPAYHVDHEE